MLIGDSTLLLETLVPLRIHQSLDSSLFVNCLEKPNLLPGHKLSECRISIQIQVIEQFRAIYLMV
jgi:hypothetical protein